MKKVIFGFLALVLLWPLAPVLADDTIIDLNADVTAAELGASEAQINNASSEEAKNKNFTGTLVEIGNTTAEETTIIIRETKSDGSTSDQTIEIQKQTSLENDSGQNSDLSDWIAGDQISVTADESTNSGQLVAKSLKNRAMKAFYFGRNGWITAIHPEKNTVEVSWQNQIFTLNLKDAKIVAGIKNPAAIADLKVGDRVRARVIEDGDKNPATWNAKILVVLRRGNDLFMRVTRWVVPAKITMIPEDLTLPVTIEVEVRDSKFYQTGDVNNLIGAPGTKLTVDLTKDTKMVRRFFGRAMLKEFQEGDIVRIIGRRDENTGHLVAQFFKNESLQRLGVAQRVIKVSAVDAVAGTITGEMVRSNEANRTITILVGPNTKIYKAGQLIQLSDIQVSDLLRVRGTANRQAMTIAADLIQVAARKFMNQNGEYTFDYAGTVECQNNEMMNGGAMCFQSAMMRYNPYGFDFIVSKDSAVSAEESANLEKTNFENNENLEVKQFVSLTDETVAGNPAKRLVTVSKDEGTWWNTEHLFFKRGADLYHLIYNSHKQEKPGLEIFNQAANSLSFTAR